MNLRPPLTGRKGTRIQIGGQNLHWVKEGAFTGEVSAGMLRATGCKWVIVAHSERREYFGETEATALKKICAALDAGLTPIYCVGEKLHEREGQQDARGARPPIARLPGSIDARAISRRGHRL